MRDQLGATLPHVNAALNATCVLLLVLGRVAIARGARALHKRLMLSALTVSAVFLASYLVRFALTGSHRYEGAWKPLYLAILFSHMALAAVTPVLVILAVRHALADRLDAHRRLVRYAYPIWLYVSVTGVIVYWMLYRL